jgi:hypothetical protein
VMYFGSLFCFAIASPLRASELAVRLT